MRLCSKLFRHCSERAGAEGDTVQSILHTFSNAKILLLVLTMRMNLMKIDRGRMQPANYSRTSMARTSLGPWKFVRDMGSSSH